MLYLTANPGDKLILGRAGEHLARTVRFDIARWRALYGDGTAALILRRPGEAEPYPCVVSQEGDIVTWPITRVETARLGTTGRYELQYLVGEQVVKSAMGIAVVYDALSEPAEEPPEAQQGWVDQVLTAGVAAAAAAEATARDAEQVAADRKAVENAMAGGGGSGGGGGVTYRIGHGLKLEDNELTVDSVSNFDRDNTLPATAALVQTAVGNIETLLSTI